MAESPAERQKRLGDALHRVRNLYGAFATSGGSWASLLWDYYGALSAGPTARSEALRKALQGTDQKSIEARLDAWVDATAKLAEILKAEMRAIRETPP